MFANSSELLSHIRTIIQNSSKEPALSNIDFTLIEKIIQKSKNSASNNGVVQLNRLQLKKIEERIQKLEEQNEHLFCVVYFLFDRISNLALGSGKNSPTESKKNNQGHDCRKNAKEEKLAFMENKQRPELTKRERDILSLLEQGLCAKEIAKVLFISETTVITHKKNLKEKFDAKNTVELMSKVLAK